MTSSTVSKTLSTRLLIGALVAAVIGMFTVTAFAFEGGHGHRGGRHGAHGDPTTMFMGRGLERMLDSVDATPEQRSQIRQIAEAAATDLRAQRDGRRELRERTMQLFTQPTVDSNAAEQLRQQMLAHHDQASRRMMQAMLDVSRVLTPEQRRQMAERMAQRRDMMERHRRERQQLDGGAR